MRLCTATFLMAALVAAAALAQAQTPANRYVKTHLVSNKELYKPQIIEPRLINAWGIAIRPAGAGGHFWVTGFDTSFQYVGDVHASSDEMLRLLHTDDLPYVTLPIGGEEQFATGVVFSASDKHFTITQEMEGAEPITAPAKFIFASDGGIISAWTERKREDGGFDRPVGALAVIDQSKQGSQFFGLAISAAYDRLYAADFGETPGIDVFDGDFLPIPSRFASPFDENKNGKVDAGEYAPFNVQTLTTPEGKSHVFVTYAKTQACPKEEAAQGNCKEGEIFAGEEDTSQPGYGRLAEFNEDGTLIAVWEDGGMLSAPWGLAYAPDDFGALGGALLVSNFGSGTIAAYDATKHTFIDMLRDPQGNPIVIDKIWGIVFGNGASLGDKQALYFAAGPDEEKDGVFGSLRYAPPESPAN